MQFHSVLRAVVEENGGKYLQGPNKSLARAIEKIENDYDGDHLKLVDVVRGMSGRATLHTTQTTALTNLPQHLPSKRHIYNV